MTTTKRCIPYQREKRCVLGACALLLFVFSLYIYFVSASVVHVVMRKELNQEIVAMGSYVSQLESDYIEAQHKVSADIATLAGFVAADEKVFIDRTPASLVLLDKNEI